MSSLSRCTVVRDTPKVLPPLAMLQVLAVFAVVLGFGVAHLSLRFHLNKIQVETSRLQTLQGTLASEVKALQGRTEALKHPKRLFEYARLELGMVPCRPDEQRKVVRMRSDLYARYEVARANLGGQSAPAPYDGAPWIEKLSGRVGLIGQALAGENN